jgi:hypothetical protein
MANGLDIMNKSNRPIFVTCNKQEVMDINIVTFYAGNFIKNWHVSEEVSCSDHRYIRFTVTGTNRSIEVYRNPRRTDWESFGTDLSGCLCKMMDKVNDFVDLETAAEEFQEATRINPGGPQELAERRRKLRRLFNAAKKAGNWTYYKRTLTEYNKALRQAKRESCRRL